ncbi:MAG: coth protein-domain-containing protein [Podila humilis]|nr:MAG: coth protein-domain-containing protein [Podila humilis]
MRFLLPGLMALATTALADVTYNVVGFPDTPGGSFAVEVNGKTHKLTTTPATFPLWSANVAGASASSAYKYVKLSDTGVAVQKESFKRSFANKKATATVNEFFQRQITQNNLPKVPQVYKDVRSKAAPNFDETQIGTIHVTADPAIFDDMVKNPLDEERKAIKASFRFINANNVYSVEEVKMKVSGHGSRKFKKLSFRLKFDDDKGETFFNHPIIKLRSEAFDPTLIREKLYIDVLNSAGIRTTQGTWTRLYVNGQAYGFYLMVDDVEPPLLSNLFHNGELKPKQLGSLYQMGSHVAGLEATLQYNGSRTADYHPGTYANKNLGANTKEEPMAQLISFFKDLQDFNPALPGGVAYWSKRLNLEDYLRQMAVEYLGGSWDMYWWKGNNFFMYFNPTTNVWQWVPTDFDSTFSNGNLKDVEVPYKQFAASRLRRKGKDHPLITKLIYKNKEINGQFEKTLLTLAKGVFNPKALEPRINAYEKMIQDEVKWDLSINRSKNPGRTFGYTLDDFHKSITGPVKTVNNGIKPWISYRAKDVPKQIASGKSALASQVFEEDEF